MDQREDPPSADAPGSRPATRIMAGDDRLNIRAQAQNPLADVRLGLRTKVQNHQVQQAPPARRSAARVLWLKSHPLLRTANLPESKLVDLQLRQ
jgi:hypothetical protein